MKQFHEAFTDASSAIKLSKEDQSILMLFLSTLFAHDGAVLINISTQKDLKDIHILPFTTHIRVYYTTLDVPEELLPMLRYGLHVAARNFNLLLEFLDD